MTGVQYSYSFISDGLGTLKSCKYVCGKAITMSSDYNLTFNEDEECQLKVVPEDAKTKEVVHILQSMHIRPGMYFGKTRSYIALRAFLFGYGAGVRVQGEEECYWSHDLGYEVDSELREILAHVDAKERPRCTTVDGLSVLDDVGGLGGFQDMLETLASNDTEEKAGMREWARGQGWTGRISKPENFL